MQVIGKDLSYRLWLQETYPAKVYDELCARVADDYVARVRQAFEIKPGSMLSGSGERPLSSIPAVREAIDRMLHYSRKIPAVKLSKDAHHTWKRMLRVQEIRRRMGSIKHQATLYCMADAQHRMEVAR